MTKGGADRGTNGRIAFVVSDIDGALVTPDKALTPRAVVAVERLAAADTVTAANTDEGFARAIEELVLPRVMGR
ncbi:MAG TPA: hypothetical protein VF459_12330 [Caulobacteraceae bacterium]